jgi:hypothetical protein
MSNKTKLKIKRDRFSEFVDKLVDLTGISDTIKLKIDSENIMIYSTLGGAVMLAFKNYLLKTNEFLEWNEEESGQKIDVIIVNAKKFVKNLNFLRDSEKLTIDITHKPSPDDDTLLVARSIQINGGRLKVNWIAGENFEIRDIDKTIITERLNLTYRNWNFIIDKTDFFDIKKLSSINDSKLLNITVSNGKVIISEQAAWELQVANIDESRNSNMILNKKFLKCIDDTKDIDFSIFDNFMLIKDGNTNLMLSYEQNFTDEDE